MKLELDIPYRAAEKIMSLAEESGYSMSEYIFNRIFLKLSIQERLDLINQMFGDVANREKDAENRMDFLIEVHKIIDEWKDDLLAKT